MDLLDKKAWLKKYGYTQFEFVSKLSGLHVVQWHVFDRAMIYIGRGKDADRAYDDLYDRVVDVLYGICE